MAHYEKKQAAKKAENEEKFKLLKYAHIKNLNLLIKIYSIRAETKALSRISGVCWDYEYCDGTRLKGCKTIMCKLFAPCSNHRLDSQTLSAKSTPESSPSPLRLVKRPLQILLQNSGHWWRK